MDSVPAPRHRSRWSLLSLLVLAAPLAILNPSLADPLKQLETGFCSGCALSGADLRGRDLRGFYLIGADLRGADLIGADLSGAELSGSTRSPGILNSRNTTRREGRVSFASKQATSSF